MGLQIFCIYLLTILSYGNNVHTVGHCFVQDVNYNGPDIQPKEFAQSAFACRERCQKLLNCSYFSFNDNSDQCYLRDVVTDKPSYYGYISGPKNCTGTCGEMDIEYDGIDLHKEPLNISSFVLCREKCQAH